MRRAIPSLGLQLYSFTLLIKFRTISLLGKYTSVPHHSELYRDFLSFRAHSIYIYVYIVLSRYHHWLLIYLFIFLFNTQRTRVYKCVMKASHAPDITFYLMLLFSTILLPSTMQCYSVFNCSGDAQSVEFYRWFDFCLFCFFFFYLLYMIVVMKIRYWKIVVMPEDIWREFQGRDCKL